MRNPCAIGPPKAATLAAHAAREPGADGDVAPPIRPSTTYARDEAYELIVPGTGYSRDENPTYGIAETAMTGLEGGAEALLFASGMAAATAILQTLKPGDHIVAPKIMYWGLRNWMITFCRDWGLELDLFEAGAPNALADTLKPGKTKLVWIETPCNPTWDVINIAAAAQVTHAVGALLAVDSTVATPVLTRPLDHGADLVFHSGTKYLNGHGDVVAGLLVTARRDDFWQGVRGWIR